MHFSSIINVARQGERILFFQSSYPYLNSQSLVPYKKTCNRRWTQRGPRPSNRGRWFLGIASGHYGVYYTMYNEDSEKHRGIKVKNVMTNDLKGYMKAEYDSNFSPPSFLISNVNREIYNGLVHLKEIKDGLLSSFVVRKSNVATLTPKRSFTTFTYKGQNQRSKNIEKDEVHTSVTEENVLQEPSFIETQIKLIRSIWYGSIDPEELNLIYPIYQAILRNESKLPSIELYNIVLKSITKRSLDSALTIKDTESRLTTLLTVYEDLLTSRIKPDSETLEIVLSELFTSSCNVIDIGNQKNAIEEVVNESTIKSMEFCKLGVDLFNSIRRAEELDLSKILPHMLKALNVHPQIINKTIVQNLINIKLPDIADGQYYVSLIRLSSYYADLDVFKNKEDVYEYVCELYNKFKTASLNYPNLHDFEFPVYGSLIQSLIKNGNLALATKFLDTIIIDYRDQVEPSPKLKKEYMCHLMSMYIRSFVNFDNNSDSNWKGYELLKRFNSNAYLPELKVSVYNDLINNFANEIRSISSDLNYTLEEDAAKELKLRRNQIYEIIWSLYDYVAIRKDFQQGEFDFISPFKAENSHCRDTLLSLSIDMRDHEGVFQLIKEILIGNHLVRDMRVFHKLCHYLYSASALNGSSSEYFGLLWNLFENQWEYYKGKRYSLNNFISNFVKFMIIDQSDYNVGIIVNSVMINNAFKTFKLREDNVYGLWVISEYLSKYAYDLDYKNIVEVAKILHLQALMILETEDAENHFINVDPITMESMQSLKECYIRLFKYALSMGIQLSKATFEVGRLFELEIQPALRALELDSDLAPKVNLSHTLTIDFDRGMEKFQEYFRKGYNFDYDTWSIVLSSQIIDYGPLSGNIHKKTLIRRIINSTLSREQLVNLFERIVTSGDDKTIISAIVEIFNMGTLSKDGRLLRRIIETYANSGNKYMGDILVDKFGILMQCNSIEWKVAFSKTLIDHSRSQDLLYLVEKYSLFSNLNLETDDDSGFFINVMFAMLKMRNYDQFYSNLSHLRNNFKPCYNRLLTSTRLPELLVTYYLFLGDLDSMMDVIKDMNANSVNEAPLFASFILSLKERNARKNMKSSDGTSALLNYDLRYIKENKASMKYDIDSVLNDALAILIKASLLLQDEYSRKVLMKRFRNLFKSLKYLENASISSTNFVLMINFLSISDDAELLYVIFHKIFRKGVSADLVNIFGMEILVERQNEKSRVFTALGNAFKYLNDVLSIKVIDEFCGKNGLAFNLQGDYEKYLHELFI